MSHNVTYRRVSWLTLELLSLSILLITTIHRLQKVCVPWVVDWRSAVYEDVVEVVVVAVGVDVTAGVVVVEDVTAGVAVVEDVTAGVVVVEDVTAGVVVVVEDVTAGVVMVDSDVTAGVMVVDADVTASVLVVVDVVDDDEDEDEVVAAAEESPLVVSGSVRLVVSAARPVMEVELTGSEMLVQSDWVDVEFAMDADASITAAATRMSFSLRRFSIFSTIYLFRLLFILFKYYKKIDYNGKMVVILITT